LAFEDGGYREGAEGLNLISGFAQLLIRQCQAMLLHFHSACEINNKNEALFIDSTFYLFFCF